MDFDTIADQWTVVKLPVDQFVAHSYGRPMTNLKLTPAEVQAVGILLGEKNLAHSRFWSVKSAYNKALEISNSF